VRALPLHDRIEDPVAVVEERLTLACDSVHVRPVEGEIEMDRLTVSVKPFTPVTVTVDVAVWPARTVAVAGLAENVKSVGRAKQKLELPE
jgi:hypothetical protein